MTKEQERLFNAMRTYIDYWEIQPNKSVREKLEGFAFCVLVIIDGECGYAGPYSMRPVDENNELGEDISGNLHDLFFQGQARR